MRRAPESGLELLRRIDRPTLPLSGGRRELLPLIRGAPLRAKSPAGPRSPYTETVGSGNAEVLRDGRYDVQGGRGGSRPAFAPARCGWSSPRRP
ncbi:hypothetical protein [Streptomyces camelliae]|uniref:hypothetical protein n=1 Tax=Streptomyces camelliae TaxID=3004093 RepID=UPI003D164EE2